MKAKCNTAILGIFLILLVMSSCQRGGEYYPKPVGYHRIKLPQHEYITFKKTDFPYSFDIAQETKVIKDTSWIAEPYWIDILYPNFNASIQISYKPIQKKRALLEEYLNTAFKLTSKHNVKASAIEEQIILLPNKKHAAVYELSGEVPSQFQFSVTDSVDHFMMGALYFDESTKNDSLKPVIEHIKIDMIHMLNTLQWGR